MNPKPAFIQGLLQPVAYSHPAATVRLIETHISWVFIAGDHAYKLKKPLDLGFLDFSTLERRRFCCEEEIRLNRRLAPEIYLDVVPVTGTESQPRMGGEGPVLEWAVRMRAFPADATLDREQNLAPAQIDAIADVVARFHAEIAPAPPESAYGTPEVVYFPVGQNFEQIRGLNPPPDSLPLLERLEAWSQSAFTRLRAHFAARKAAGFVRECHGDLHLGNIAWVDDLPLIFDCIEFNPNLRFVDITSEAAFFCMDLTSRGLEPLAWRFLNCWLELTGDYPGLAAFRFYQVYRAMVRAKVAFIRANQNDAPARQEALGYLALAERLSRPARPALLLMHGVSGSGKTWLSQQILEGIGAIRMRSDVERKRLFGLSALADSRRVEGGIYTEEASRRTFDRLAKLARQRLQEGFTVIVDATFLRRAHRAPFLALARETGVPLRILSLQVDESRLRQRVAERTRLRDDASEADLEVLEDQLRAREPFTAEERASVVVFDDAEAEDWPKQLAELRQALPG
jgi:uncharacterized protein